MILAQLIRYENAPALEATWVDEDGAIVRCHAYSNAQMDMLRADLGEDAAHHESLISEIEASYVPPPPPPPQVPDRVTRRQARRALALAGLLDLVQPAIDSIPDPVQRQLAQIDWDDAVDYRRDDATLNLLATALGLTEQQLDELFILASNQP